MTSIRKRWVPVMACLAFTLLVHSAEGQKKNAQALPDQKDTVKKPVVIPSSIKPYKELIDESARTLQSFYTVHIVKDRYYFEVPDSLLDKDVLAVTRIEKGADGFVIPLLELGYSGDEFGRSVITFEKIPGDKLAMRSRRFLSVTADTGANSLSRSLANNNVPSIEAVFPVKSYNKDGYSTVIDLTDFFSGKAMTDALIAPSFFTSTYFIGLVPDRSYINDVKAFSQNIEISTTKSISKDGRTNTIQLNTSFIQLPKQPMRARRADPRVGYLANDYVDYGSNPYGVAPLKYIQRWRLEPKDQDIEKYLKGELVEPEKPIIIYIDSATPKKWVPYLIAGINDWQAAFEKAGFKNAIVGKEAPVNDSSWSSNDSRHSMVMYKPSPNPNAMGPNVNDPRTGEILETHISWFHSVMTVLRLWYITQAGAIDTAACQPEFDDNLMGELIRFVSSHEVGHTLGLKHNFGASSTVPVEKLRDKQWVEEHGHTPSIMDYARFNYVAQPEDHIGRKGIFPRIGDYDKWAIEWGYRWFPSFKTAEQEKAYMNQWIVSKLASGKQFFYGSQLNPYDDGFSALNLMDPRSQSEDLGDDAVLASTYGIKNLKRIRPQLIKWAAKPNENYDNVELIYNELVKEFSRFMGHVARNINGIYTTPKTREQPGDVFEVVSRDKQKRAMLFLQQELFNTPEWLKDDKLFMISTAGFEAVTQLQGRTLKELFDKVEGLQKSERDFDGKGYPAREMLTDLRKGIFSELASGKAVTDPYRRDLQNLYVNMLAERLVKTSNVASEYRTLMASHARSLSADLKIAAAASHDNVTKEHVKGLYGRLQDALAFKPNSTTLR